jgi:hypothetical protein
MYKPAKRKSAKELLNFINKVLLKALQSPTISENTIDFDALDQARVDHGTDNHTYMDRSTYPLPPTHCMWFKHYVINIKAWPNQQTVAEVNISLLTSENLRKDMLPYAVGISVGLSQEQLMSLVTSVSAFK